MSKEIIERQLAIAKEGFDYYLADPSRRAVSPTGSCYYRTPGEKARCCIVGRHMIDPSPDLAGLADCLRLPGDFDLDLEERRDPGRAAERLNGLLKEESRGLSVRFWVAMQTWHDQNENWYPPSDLDVYDKPIDGAEYDIARARKGADLLLTEIEEGMFV